MNLVKVLTLAVGFALVTSAGAAVAAERVLNTEPKPDAALLPYAPGFAPIEGTTMLGNPYKHNEGIVIRESRIENGKIIIPPSGLYYTNRGPRSYLLRGDILNITGKPYYLVYNETQAGVVTNRTMKPGDRFEVAPGKVFELLNIKLKDNGHPTPVANFRVLRPSGVPVGGVPNVSTTPISDDVRTFALSGKADGVYPVSTDFRVDLLNYTSDLSASASKYIKIKDLTDESVVVEEAMFHVNKVLYVTATPPTTGYYAPGDSVALGDFTVKVVSVDQAAQSAKVQIVSKAGKTTEKTLSMPPADIIPLLTNAELEARELMSMRDPNFKVQVELSPYRRTPAFNNDKVALNLYTDLVKLEAGIPWAADTRFIYRPDT